ncbi:TPA: ATP-binding protein [Photobacterium damselae]
MTLKYRINEILQEQSGLTVKEISEILQECPNKLHAFLIGNDSFISDSEQWYQKEDFVCITFKTERTWLDEHTTEEILKQNHGIWDDKIKYITLRFIDCSILLESISRILAFINQLTFYGKNVTLDFTACKKSFSYLCRAGLFDLIHKTVAVRPEKQDCSSNFGKSNSLIEFGQIAPYSKKTGLPLKLKDAFSSLTSEELARPAFTVISEFINNIIEHSHTQTPGFAALQSYNGSRKKIQTVFSDNGKGIINTLRAVLKERYPELDRKYPLDTPENNVDLLQEVFVYGGVSGANDEQYEGRGLGFKASSKKAAQFNADITIRQETFSLHLTYTKGEPISAVRSFNLLKLNGTHIVFNFYVD